MNDSIKKLTGKNPKDYEQVAQKMINDSDVNLFEELVKQDDFLFDFIKNNVAKRLQNACNSSNYRNLLAFLKVYSPYYEDFITSVLAKFADEDLTDEILEIFENGTENEKTYCAKYFSRIQDPLALDLLRKYAFSENESLSANCAMTLGNFGDKESYEQALAKLNSEDDFEVFNAISFLVSYGDKNSAQKIIEILPKSSMAENIAGEIPYLVDLFTILETNTISGLTVINHIINGIGEILPLSSVLDYELYWVLESLISLTQNSAVTTVLLNAREKFNTLTENDEYLFDEDNNTKNEVLTIHNLLQKANISQTCDAELKPDSPFVYTALEFTTNSNAVKRLLTCNNQTVILKSAEVLKKLNAWNEEDKTQALQHITDDNIKSIIEAL